MSTRFAAVLLAAGKSRRMGAINKLMLPVDGVPLVRRTAEVLLDAGLGEVVVVLGHEAERIGPLLIGLALHRVYNPRFAEGQMGSVHRGLEALETACDGVLIALADQPLLESADIHRICAAFTARAHGSVVVPTWQGRRGNPIVLAWSERTRILEGGRNLGCRHLIDNNPELVCAFEFSNDHVVVDLDTPDDRTELNRRLAVARPSAPATRGV